MENYVIRLLITAVMYVVITGNAYAQKTDNDSTLTAQVVFL
jgi:hypothetical protein